MKYWVLDNKNGLKYTLIYSTWNWMLIYALIAINTKWMASFPRGGFWFKICLSHFSWYEVFEVLIILLIHNRSKQFCTVWKLTASTPHIIKIVTIGWGWYVISQNNNKHNEVRAFTEEVSYILYMQGLFVPFARVGSGDPVRVLRLFHNKYSGYCCIHSVCKAMYKLSLPRLSANYYGLPTRHKKTFLCFSVRISRTQQKILSLEMISSWMLAHSII